MCGQHRAVYPSHASPGHSTVLSGKKGANNGGVEVPFSFYVCSN